MADCGGDEKASSTAPLVFISYASQDAAVANSIVESLEQQGLRCWLAPRDVKPGAQYADAIVGAINEARAVVLLLSQTAVESSHVGREVERSASKHKPIIAFRIDAATLSRALEYFLSESQWIDVPAIGMPAALAKLAEAVAQASGQTIAAGPVGSARPLGRTGGRAKLIAGAAVVISVGVAVVLGVHFWSQSHKAAPATAAVAITDKSIAVLPFADLSATKDQEYFADGVAEEVLDRLAKVPGLRVVGRASSFQFRGKDADPARVGAALGVAYLLEGSVRREAGRVRVTAQLVEAQTGQERWSDHFDSGVIDILGVQDTLAAELARALQIAVEVDATPHTAVKSPEALDAYLRGRQSLARASREGCESAVAHFQRALVLDPTFAPAAVGLARAYAFMGSTAWLPTKVAFERAREAAQLAQGLDPKSPSAHVSMAWIHLNYDWEWAGAARELQQAFTLGPRDSYGSQIAGRLAAALSRWDEARQSASEAITLDPLDADAIGAPGFEIYLRTGYLAEAEQSFRRALQIAPGWSAGHYFLGVALMLQGQYDAALTEFKKEKIEDGRFEGSAMVYFVTGRKAESDAQLAAAIHQNGDSWPSEIARVYAVPGEKDRAFEWLDRAYKARDEDLYFARSDPLLKNLESDPRYKAFFRKMNLPD